jgi:hypothetical protein
LVQPLKFMIREWNRFYQTTEVQTQILQKLSKLKKNSRLLFSFEK